MPGNARRGQPQGKCHRNYTALRSNPESKGEMVRQERTALPATAAARQTPPGARPNRGGTNLRVQGCFRLTARVGRAKPPATEVPDEWSSSARSKGQARTEPGLQAGWHLLFLGLVSARCAQWRFFSLDGSQGRHAAVAKNRSARSRAHGDGAGRFRGLFGSGRVG